MGELDEENLHLALSIDVSLKRVVSTFLVIQMDIHCPGQRIQYLVSILHVHIVYISNLLLVNYILKTSQTNYRRALKEDEKMMRK